MLFAQDFPANHIPQPEKEKDRQTKGMDRQTCYALSEMLNHGGLLAKTLLGLPWGKLKHSDTSSMVWSLRATQSGVLIFRLAPLDYRRWSGTSGLLPRTMASDLNGSGKKRFRTGFNKGNFRELIRESETDGIYPNPDFCEWIKGFPENWTSLDESE